LQFEFAHEWFSFVNLFFTCISEVLSMLYYSRQKRLIWRIQ